jgi:hypothetical protein
MIFSEGVFKIVVKITLLGQNIQSYLLELLGTVFHQFMLTLNHIENLANQKTGISQLNQPIRK